MRKFLLFFCIILLAQSIPAKPYILHTVDVRLDHQGNARISESFKFDLSNSSDLEKFEKFRSVSNFSHISDMYENISFFVTREPQDMIISSRGPESGYGWISLEYSTDSFAYVEDRTSTLAKWSLGSDNFEFEKYGQNLFIPDRIHLAVSIPSDSEFTELKPRPHLELSNDEWKTAQWNGPISSSVFQIKYSVPQKVTESVGFEELIDAMENFMEDIKNIGVVLGITGIAIVSLILLREKILSFISRGFRE